MFEDLKREANICTQKKTCRLEQKTVEEGRRCRGWPDVSDYRVPVCRMPSKGYRVPGFLRRRALRNWRA